VELAAENHGEEDQRIRSLRDRLQRSIQEQIPYTQVNGEKAVRLPNTLNVSIHFIEGEGMLFQLSEHGICASSGSACTSGSLEPSHVLQALHVPFTAIHGSIRFSLSRYNTDEDVDRIIEVFPEIVASLRKLSPYWDNERNSPRAEAEHMLTHTAVPAGAGRA
jgi:cysteine desulfurase